MRILVDLHNFRWDEAWKITVATLSYTNHTLLPEALETWPVELFERLLPRHLEIIYRINVQHLALAEARCPGDIDFRASVSLIDEKSGRRVRMGQLAFVGSHRINGVSAMHSDLMRETVFHDLNHLYPGRITNKTNGITFRRWLMLANPKLTDLLRETCGEAVLDDPTQLSLIEARASDVEFQKNFRAVKHANKAALARLIGERLGIKVDPNALFDVQIKRIHEYKRQLLNVIETVALYQAIKDDPNGNWVPRVKIFAGKAAASYRYAKLIIKLINDVADIVNNDPAIDGKLKVAFLPDYNVSLAEVIIPAADLSEQISTAGMEASGTGNMKLALNGAITIGTLDGANIEIRDHVGPENIAIFGLEAGDVMIRRKQGLDASDIIRNSPKLQRAINAIGTGEFSPGDPPVVSSPSRTRCAISTITWSAPISIPITRRSARSTRAGWCRRPGRAPPSSTSRAWRGSARTAPSANTPRRSGTCRSIRRPRCCRICATSRADFPRRGSVVTCKVIA
ncbi:glycogen/starch/alpha-glucan phosphorylase-like protein [Bradyrhizobium daqingense]